MRERIVWITADPGKDDHICLWKSPDLQLDEEQCWTEIDNDQFLQITIIWKDDQLMPGFKELLQAAGIKDEEIQDHPVKIKLTFDLKRA